MSDRGDLIKLEIELRDEGGTLRDPNNVELTVKSPAGTVTTHAKAALTHVSAGIYAFDLLLAEAGTYAYRWVSTGNPELAETGRVDAKPGLFDDEGPPTWTPTTEEVAAIIRARVQKRGGIEGTDWDDTTRPTKAQVEEIVAFATSRVATATVWNPCTYRLRSESRGSAAMYAALLVEQSYWPESASNTTSSFSSLLKLWEDGLPDLKERITKNCPDETGGGEEEEPEDSAGYALPKGGYDEGDELVGRNYPTRGNW